MSENKTSDKNYLGLITDIERQFKERGQFNLVGEAAAYFLMKSRQYLSAREETIEGKWPKDDLRRAFVEGAKWWEYQWENATMWPSDVDRAEAEAEKRYSYVNSSSSKEPK